MKKRFISLLMAVMMTAISISGNLPHTIMAENEAEAEVDKSVYMDADQPVSVRVQALLEQMTLEEKIAQMIQPEQNASNGGASIKEVKMYGIGSVLSGGGSAPSAGNTAEDWRELVDSYIAASLESRLGIPLIYGVDGVHGHNNVEGTTIFPHNIGLGATGNTELTKRIGAAAAEEIRATGIQWTFAPTLGIVHNERWGRFYECFGETADIVSAMGEAYVKGFQGEMGSEKWLSSSNVAATAKHFIGEGLAENGENQGEIAMSQEEFETALEEELLAPYRAVIEAGVQTVMVTYNSVNGVKCHGNTWLITDILKNRLGFEGLVISDYNAIQQLPGTYEEQVEASVNAGIDMFMEPFNWKNFMITLRSLVREERVSQERIDDAVARILTVKFNMGLFEDPYSDKSLLDTVGSEKHRALARQAVKESLTLLKNDKIGSGQTIIEALADYDNILVAGQAADDMGIQCGGWTITWQGSTGDITDGTTVLEGIREAVGDSKKISYSRRGKVTKGQQAAIVVVGEEPYAESDGDRTESGLTLSDRDKAVIRTIREYDKDIPIILIILTGRPLTIAEDIDECAAVVCAWLPGTEGGGIADVLFGSDEFKGTTTVTWPWYGQNITEKESDESVVLFPRGTGLKKDGTSIQAGGQTAIGTKPKAPLSPEVSAGDAVMKNGGISLYDTGYVVEAEWMNDDSWLVEAALDENGTGIVNNWSQQWANAKWKVYVPSSGTYHLIFTAAVENSSKDVKIYYQTPAIEDDGNANAAAVPFTGTEDMSVYEEFTVKNVELKEGIYEFKLMNTGSISGLNLDKITFEPIGVEALEESTKEITEVSSDAKILKEDSIEVYMTSAEKSKNMIWYVTPQEMENKLEKKDSLNLTETDDTALTTIDIDMDTTYQSILGFGISLEESSIWNLSQLQPEIRRGFLKDLVDPINGAGMTLFRLTIGTSDFTGQKFYTYYDELTTEEPDWYNETGEGFSIQKDIDCRIIETVLELLEVAEECGVKEEIRFFASSWTPPGWMKQSTGTSLGYSDNELLLKGGKLKDDCIDALAMYYTRYLEEYAKLGIHIYGITLQNEPLLEIDYPSCYMTGVQEGRLAVAVKKSVESSEILNEYGVAPKLWAYDHNCDSAKGYVKEIFSVEGAEEAVDGIAFHDYSGQLSAIQDIYDTYKEQKDDFTVNLTERSVWGTEGADRIIQYLRNGAISYNSWVTMLDSSISHYQWTGVPDPTMFVRDKGSDNDYWAAPEYYITGQFAKFIRPGAVRVESDYGSENTITNVAFYDEAENTMILVAVNQTDTEQTFKAICKEQQFIGTIPAKHVATYTWQIDSDHINSQNWWENIWAQIKGFFASLLP